MFDAGSTREHVAVNSTSYHRGESRPVSQDVFIPKPEKVIDVSQISLRAAESAPFRDSRQANFFDITEPPPIYKLRRPMTAERYVDEALYIPPDLIEVSQTLAKILFPAIALGSLAGMIAYLTPLIPGALQAIGTVAMGILMTPPGILAAGAAFLIWAAFQIRNENETYLKAESVRASRRTS